MDSAKTKIQIFLKDATSAIKKREFVKAKELLLKCARWSYELALKSEGAEKKRYYELGDQARRQAKGLEPQIKPIAPKKLPKEPAAVAAKPAAEDAANQDWLLKPGQTGSDRFDDIAGLDEVKDQIRTKIIYPFLYPELAKEYGVSAGGGMLLYGPPGTGKTMIARATANEVEAPMYSLIPSDVMSKWVGESEQRIRALFEEIRSQERAILFIDELEGLMPDRSTHSTVMQRVVPQFLAEMDGMKKRSGTLLLIGASNVPWQVDSAAYRPGRFDTLVYVPLPDWSSRRKLLQIICDKNKRIQNLDYDLLADKTERFSGADISHLVNTVLRTKFHDAIRTATADAVGMDDFLDVMAKTTPSVRDKDLGRFSAFKAEFGK